MNYRIILLLFLGLTSFFAQANTYLVTVYGRLIDGAGKGVAGRTIYINQSPNSPFVVSEKAPTYESGEFKWPVYIQDSVRHGVLILSFVNCEGKEVIARFEFSKEKPLIEAKLVFCARPLGKECTSSVEVKRLNDSMALAIVIAKGKAPFIHKWTTGEEGDTIVFNPQNKIKICVVTKDSTGCVSEACIPTTPAACAVYIEHRDNYLVAIVKEGDVKSFLWSTGADGNKIEIKERGEYCVRIITVNGCEAKACYLVNPVNCSAEIVAQRTGDNGSVQGYKLTVKANFDLKYIQWSTGESTAEITTKKSGEYCVSISDNKICKSYICKKIELPNNDSSCRVTIAAERIPISNTSDVVQKVKLTAKPGFKAVLYYWSTRDTTPTITVQAPGEYCVTVSDGVSCKTTACVKVELPDPNPGKCESAIVVHLRTTGELQLIPRVSGKAPFTFLWSTGSKDANLIVKTGGKYCVTIKDAGGCVSTACTEVSFEKPGGFQAPGTDKVNAGAQQLIEKSNIQLNVHPNPTADQLNYQVISRNSESGNLTVTNLYGRIVYQEKINVQEGLSSGTLDLTFLPPGVYMVHINQNGYQSSKKLILER